MQFHLNGFRTGDPELAEPFERQRAGDREALPEEVDVLIVGCGPAGLTLAAQLAAFPDITTRIVEQKSGPLQLGQADGIACRTMEMFNAFGFAERVLKEAYWVNETTFWKPDETRRGNIVRSGRVQDVEDGLSEFPHVILNQARVHDFYLEVMRKSASRLEPDYARRLIGLDIAPAVSSDGSVASHPVTATIERTDAGHEGQVETVRARYVVGCDGARSSRAQVARPGASRRFGQPGLGRHGRACGHRLPRHPPEGADPVCRRGQHRAHPAGRRLSGPHLCRARQAQRGGARREPQHHRRPSDRGGAAHPPSLYAGREGGGMVVGLRDRPAALRQVRRRAGARKSARASRVSSSPATPAIRTARRPGRA